MQTKFLGSAGRFRHRFERVTRGLRQWAGDRRGAIAVQFAFLVVPVTVLAFGLVDLNRMNTQKYNLQDSLDAAALYAARSEADTDAELQAEGEKALMANLQLMDGGELLSSDFKQEITNNQVKVVADAEVKLPAVVSNLWTNRDLKVKVHTEVNRNSKNVEVAMVLDVTGSMAGQPIIDLRAAASELIDIVVKPRPEPFYSKVAIVPYSMGVNVGEYADDVRGSVPAAKGISSIAWWKGSQKSITTIDRGGPTKITSNGHGLLSGDIIMMWGTPNSELNDKVFSVTKINNNQFSINLDTSGSDQSGGQFRSCLTTNCDVVVTSNSHGFATNDWVKLTDVAGGKAFTDALKAVSYETFQITRLSNNTFRLNGVRLQRQSSFTYNSNSGNAWCTEQGCKYLRYQNPYNSWRVHQISDCVTERSGTQKYTDNSPEGDLVGLNYPSTTNKCLSNTIYPLSGEDEEDEKDKLKAHIAALNAEGSTAGQIGLAWGWYMLSPNFGHLWPSAGNRPAAYTTANTLKVVVWMTDGANNTAYCNGVIAKDVGGMGQYSEHRNCNANNGSPDTQSIALCNAMKAKGIVIYAIGFNLAGNQAATNVVNGCATSAEHVYLPNGGAALSEAFSAIGADIENLRLSK